MEVRAVSAAAWRWSAVPLAFLALAVLVFLNAWVAEDAYITFRVIDNFANGYGLRWNVFERVQAYTHPLWLLLHLPFYALWHNLYLVSIALSIACTLAAVALALYTAKKPPLIAICLFLLPLALSKSFIDYATSGLENPLSYLLFAVFGFVLLKKNDHRYFWFFISLTVSLALLNRLDMAIVYFPILMLLVYERHAEIRWPQVIAGALPLAGWLCFSLIYYGFFFPNTKYAKLNTGMEIGRYLRQGWRYLQSLLSLDTLGALVIFSSLYFILKPVQRYSVCLALGIYGYCLYTLCVGGDYMAGRFWSFPVFATLWLWLVFSPRRLRPDIIFTLLCLFATASAVPSLLQDIRKSCGDCILPRGKVINASRTFGGNRLVMKRWPLTLRSEGHYLFGRDGKKLAQEDPPPTKVHFFIGMSGYYAGPRVKIIDMLALADPLLARLPARTKQYFYIGHFRRNIPKGYKYALESGSLERMDPALAKYYEKLQLITQGPLWDKERLKTIVNFNLGRYEHWKEEYLARQPQ